jgi:hypothetical protein
MVMHWWKNRGPNWLKSAFINGLGALVTGVTTGVVLVAKFAQGAWITLLFIPLTIVFFAIVRRHYHSVKVLTTCKVPVDAAGLSQDPIAVIAIDRWSNITRQGIVINCTSSRRFSWVSASSHCRNVLRTNVRYCLLVILTSTSSPNPSMSH